MVLVHLKSVEIEDLQFFTTSMTFISFSVLIIPSVTYICCTSYKIIYNYSMLMRSIHDFITLTKNNNIDMRAKSEVDIVIIDQCDKIMYRPKTTCYNFFIIFSIFTIKSSIFERP